MRYLRYMTWEQIAVELEYNVRHIYRMHYDALSKIQL